MTLSEIGLRALPTRRHAVIAGWPQTEANIIELARELSGRDYPFVWLDAPSEHALVQYGFGAMPRCRALPKRSLRGYWSFLTAELVVFTHGLYGNPRPAKGKTIVNVWHGEGPKRHVLKVGGGRAMVPSDYFVGASEVFAGLEAAGTGAADVLLCGQPRLTQLGRDVPSAKLDELGIDPARPFVVWLPTYRQSTGTGLVSGWADAEEPASGSLEDQFRSCLEQIVAAGAQVVFKMHPLDVLRFSIPGAVEVTDTDLADHGIGLYELIGAADALVTDYSSVWVDYLQIDRPVAFLVPDEAEFMRGRGLEPADVMEHLPGPRLTVDTAFGFGEAVVNRTDHTRSMREHSIERFGIRRVHDPARQLVDHLIDAQMMAPSTKAAV